MSLLDEIRDRANQPKVAPRQDVLHHDEDTLSIDSHKKENQPDDESKPDDNNANIDESAANKGLPTPQPPEASQPTEVAQASEATQVQHLQELLANYPEIASRIPVRLEISIKEELDQLCNREKITIETLLEALYITCREQDLLQKAITEAQRRLKTRKEAGNIRSFLTKLANLTSKGV